MCISQKHGSIHHVRDKIAPSLGMVTDGPWSRTSRDAGHPGWAPPGNPASPVPRWKSGTETTRLQRLQRPQVIPILAILVSGRRVVAIGHIGHIGHISLAPQRWDLTWGLALAARLPGCQKTRAAKCGGYHRFTSRSPLGDGQLIKQGSMNPGLTLPTITINEHKWQMSKSLSLPAPLRCNAAFAELPLARIACSQHIHHLTSQTCQECSLAALATGQMKLTQLVLLTWNILKPQIASVGLRYHLLQSPAYVGVCSWDDAKWRNGWAQRRTQLGALADEPSQEPPHRHFLGAHGCNLAYQQTQKRLHWYHWSNVISMAQCATEWFKSVSWELKCCHELKSCEVAHGHIHLDGRDRGVLPETIHGLNLVESGWNQNPSPAAQSPTSSWRHRSGPTPQTWSLTWNVSSVS